MCERHLGSFCKIFLLYLLGSSYTKTFSLPTGSSSKTSPALPNFYKNQAQSKTQIYLILHHKLYIDILRQQKMLKFLAYKKGGKQEQPSFTINHPLRKNSGKQLAAYRLQQIYRFKKLHKTEKRFFIVTNIYPCGPHKILTTRGMLYAITGNMLLKQFSYVLPC